VRQDLYIRWTTLRGFRPDIGVIRNILSAKKIPVRLLYGRFDRIIRWETGDRFRRRAPAADCALIILPSGHQLLQPQNKEAILSLLK
jgi:pimeloyl-ACP methyl ester carboxylesterase